jgi:hypothetical protein
MSGRKRTEFGDELLEANILSMKKEPGDGFESVIIDTAAEMLNVFIMRRKTQIKL